MALLVAVMLIRPPAEMLQDGSFDAALAAHMTARETRMVWLEGAVVLRFAGPPGGAVKVLQLKFKGESRLAFCATVRVGVKASSATMVIEDWKCICCLRGVWLKQTPPFQFEAVGHLFHFAAGCHRARRHLCFWRLFALSCSCDGGQAL